MEQYDQIGARLDRLPLARFHYRIFGIISFSGDAANLLI